MEAKQLPVPITEALAFPSTALSDPLFCSSSMSQPQQEKQLLVLVEILDFYGTKNFGTDDQGTEKIEELDSSC